MMRRCSSQLDQGVAGGQRGPTLRARAVLSVLVCLVVLLGQLTPSTDGSAYADPGPDCAVAPVIWGHDASEFWSYDVTLGTFSARTAFDPAVTAFDIGEHPDGRLFLISPTAGIFRLDPTRTTENTVGFGTLALPADPGGLPAINANMLAFDKYGYGYVVSTDGNVLYRFAVPDTDPVEPSPLTVEVVAQGLTLGEGAPLPAGSSSGDVIFLGGNAYIGWSAGAQQKLVRIDLTDYPAEGRYDWAGTAADLGRLGQVGHEVAAAWGLAATGGQIFVAHNGTPVGFRLITGAIPHIAQPDARIAVGPVIVAPTWVYGLTGSGEARFDQCYERGEDGEIAPTFPQPDPPEVPVPPSPPVVTRPPSLPTPAPSVDPDPASEPAPPPPTDPTPQPQPHPGPDPQPDPEPQPGPQPEPAPSPTAVPPGVSVSTVGGQPLDLEVAAGPGGAVSLTGDGFSITVAPDRDDDVAGHDEDADLLAVFTRGRAAQVSVVGFAPRSQVEVTLFSEAHELGVFTTDDAGALHAQTAVVGEEVTACPHVLFARGVLADGRSVGVSLGVWVQTEQPWFADVARRNVHHRAVGCLADLGVARGVSSDTYRPSAALTRGQTASLLARLFDLDTQGSSDIVDVRGSAHEGAIAALLQLEVAQGFTNGLFQPGLPVSRGQFASLVAGMLGLAPVASGVHDAGQTHDGAIGALMHAGVLRGFPDGTVRPDDPLSRAQAASILVRATQVPDDR